MFKKNVLAVRLSLMVSTVVLSAAVLTACATDVKKVEFSSDTTPTAEINKAQADYDKGLQNDEDVLATKDFNEALSYLNTAKKEQADNADQSKIYNNLGYARAYLNRAQQVADARHGSLDGLLKTRRAAIEAGARNMNATRSDFADNDKKIQNNIEDLTTGKDVKDIDELQPSYLALEYTAIKTKNLDQANAYIQKAKEEGAESRAPRSFAQAQTSLGNAENVIRADRHNQQAIAAAAGKATTDAKLALDVTEMTKQKKINEGVALDIVRAQASNQQLTQNLKTNEQNYKNSEDEMRDQQKNLKGELSRSESENVTLAQAKALNDSLENSRKEFAPDEADAFIQGGKLVIRLKKINFPVAKADLPASALESLSKVKGVINNLNSREVVVEGHTDSTGNEASNKALSERRAQAVATYFKTDIQDAKIDSTGYGDTKPIANNKTAAGRAENRRVDVIITPGAYADSSSQKSQSL